MVYQIDLNDSAELGEQIPDMNLGYRLPSEAKNCKFISTKIQSPNSCDRGILAESMLGDRRHNQIPKPA